MVLVSINSCKTNLFQEKTRRRPSEIPRYRRGRHSRRADIRELGTERHSGEMIGFEAIFLRPDMARALGCVAAPSLVEVPESAMTCGNQSGPVPNRLNCWVCSWLVSSASSTSWNPPFMPCCIPPSSETWYIPFRSLSSIPILICPSFHQSSPPTFLARSNVKPANTWSM